MINEINIIKRIKELGKEVGLMTSSENNSSLRDLTQQILNKLISTSTGDINGKIVDLYDKMNSVYNDLASTSTNYTKGKIADLYTKFNNIYNELNSTSTSYMKGKINSIYSKSNESKEFNLLNPLILLENNDLFYHLEKKIPISDLTDNKDQIWSYRYYSMFLNNWELDKLKPFNRFIIQMDHAGINDANMYIRFIVSFSVAYKLYNNSQYNIRIQTQILDTVNAFRIHHSESDLEFSLHIYAYK